MSVVINLRDSLDAVTVPGDFMAIVTQLNIASANGMRLAILGSDDEPVAVNISNINSIREASDSFFG